MADRDPYATLGVAPDADDRAIAAAYRKLARQHHPDLNAAPEAGARMRLINEAYAVLSNPRRRAAYDRSRRRPPPAPHRTRTATTPGRSSNPYTRPSTSAANRPQPRTTAAAPAPPSRTERWTMLAGIVLAAAVGCFALVAIVLSSRLPTTTRPDGITILPRVTATALARAAAGPPPAVTAVDPQQTPTAVTAQVFATALQSSALLRDFPRPVLMPTRDLAPFNALALRPEPAIGGICREGACMSSYTVEFGTARAGARLSGSATRARFDSSAAPSARTCTPTVDYCSYVPAGRTGPDHQGEVFRGLAVRAGQPTVVSHIACCPGPNWTVSWFDPTAGASYSLELYGATAANYGDAVGPASAEGAAALVSLAAQLAVLR